MNETVRLAISIGVVIVAALPAVARGDIFQWRDDAGVMHYTNIKSEVPRDHQASMEVMVDETARRQAESEAVGPSAPTAVQLGTPAPDPPSAAPLLETIATQSLLLNAYMEGLRRGLDTGGIAAGGGSVVVNGPLAVSGGNDIPAYQNPWPYSYSYGYGWPYLYGYGWPYWYPGVAVFRHGRSAHFGRFHAGARPHLRGAEFGFKTQAR